MKILLIAINSKYIHPGMGVYQIQTNSNHETIVKEYTIKDSLDKIIKDIEEAAVDVLGLSCYIWNISIIRNILDKLKVNSTILLGGPEASYRKELLNEYPNLSYIIKNEAEESFNELIEYLKTNTDIQNVSNLYYKEEGIIKYTYTRLPDVGAIKHDLTKISDPKNRVYYIEASRGCPFNCSYCLSSLDDKVRYFDIKKVKNDLLYLIDNRVRIVKFLDRSFNIKQDYMREILSFIKDHDNSYTSFQFEIVPDLLDNESITLINTIRKGLIRFEVGIQSTNQVTTKAINRKQNIDILSKNIRAIKDNITIHADLIAGLPYEDLVSFKKTFNETFYLYPDELQLGFLKELQGTPISLSKDYHDYVFDVNPPYEVISNKYISRVNLDEVRLVEFALNKYYNSNQYLKTMNYLFINKGLNPYETFLKIAKLIKEENLPFSQIDELAKALYLALGPSLGDELLFIIKQDYLNKLVKPKIWWKKSISREERKKVYENFSSNYDELDLEVLYRYSHLECYNNEYFLINYKTKKTYFLINPPHLT